MNPPPAGWIKADFHIHSGEDPCDDLDYSAIELLHRAAELNFRALAITLHDHVLTQPEAFACARELGLLLIPAAEVRIERADVVLLNLTEEDAAGLHSFADLQALRGRRGDSLLTFAPHPFFRLGGSIGPRIRKHLECFDALEYSHFHTRFLNLNIDAVRLAKRAGKPLLATSDAHRLEFFGDHYSLIRATEPLTIEAIFTSIRAGRIRQVSPPWPTGKFLHHFLLAVFYYRLRKLLRSAQ
jgi:predicted metal-dependent phosphoesterase TrpH